MSEPVTNMRAAARPGSRDLSSRDLGPQDLGARYTVTPYLARLGRVRAFAFAAFILGAGLMLLYRPFSQSEVGDSAGYDYIAQSILRGQVPYRDVVEIKGPGSVYLSALAMAVGDLVGLRDVIAVRLFQALMVGLLSAVIFLVAQAHLRNLVAALIACSVPLMSDKFAEWMVAGTQPKLPMILFGMLTLLLIARDRPLWAGVTSMLSCLCWQPGLMFTGVAFLVFSRYLTSWRDLRALKVLIGAALPLAVVFAYFYSRGALGDLWAWTFTFNYSVFRPETDRGPWRALVHIWRVVRRIFGGDVVVVWMSVAGFVMFGIERVRAGLNGKDETELFRHAILIPPVVYFAFCIINMQAGPDLIPFIPFIGIFAGWFLVRVGDRVGRLKPSLSGLLVPVSALALVLLVAVGRGLVYRIPPGFTLQDQDSQFKVVSDLLAPDDRIYVHGTAELLVLLNRPNLNPYVFLNQGIDRFAAARRSVDFKSILDEMEAERPRLVALSRLKTVSSRDLLKQWVSERYEKLESFSYSDVYIRKGL